MMGMGDLLVPHRRCTSDARWVAGRGSDDRTGTGIRAPSAGPVDMHVWAVDGSRGARPSAADVAPLYAHQAECGARGS